MTAPPATATVTLHLAPLVAVDVRKVLIEGYGALRHDLHGPDWHMNMLRVIEDVTDQLKAGGERG